MRCEHNATNTPSVTNHRSIYLVGRNQIMIPFHHQDDSIQKRESTYLGWVEINYFFSIPPVAVVLVVFAVFISAPKPPRVLIPSNVRPQK